jgi:hypothetical protein
VWNEVKWWKGGKGNARWILSKLDGVVEKIKKEKKVGSGKKEKVWDDDGGD